jgi:hypothetical protein
MSSIQLPPAPSLVKAAEVPMRNQIFPAPMHESMPDLSVYTLTSELEEAFDENPRGGSGVGRRGPLRFTGTTRLDAYSKEQGVSRLL